MTPGGAYSLGVLFKRNKLRSRFVCASGNTEAVTCLYLGQSLKQFITEFVSMLLND